MNGVDHDSSQIGKNRSSDGEASSASRISGENEAVKGQGKIRLQQRLQGQHQQQQQQQQGHRKHQQQLNEAESDLASGAPNERDDVVVGGSIVGGGSTDPGTLTNTSLTKQQLDQPGNAQHQQQQQQQQEQQNAHDVKTASLNTNTTVVATRNGGVTTRSVATTTGEPNVGQANKTNNSNTNNNNNNNNNNEVASAARTMAAAATTASRTGRARGQDHRLHQHHHNQQIHTNDDVDRTNNTNKKKRVATKSNPLYNFSRYYNNQQSRRSLSYHIGSSPTSRIGGGGVAGGGGGGGRSRGEGGGTEGSHGANFTRLGASAISRGQIDPSEDLRSVRDAIEVSITLENSIRFHNESIVDNVHRAMIKLENPNASDPTGTHPNYLFRNPANKNFVVVQPNNLVQYAPHPMSLIVHPNLNNLQARKHVRNLLANGPDYQLRQGGGGGGGSLVNHPKTIADLPLNAASLAEQQRKLKEQQQQQQQQQHVKQASATATSTNNLNQGASVEPPEITTTATNLRPPYNINRQESLQQLDDEATTQKFKESTTITAGNDRQKAPSHISSSHVLSPRQQQQQRLGSAPTALTAAAAAAAAADGGGGEKSSASASRSVTAANQNNHHDLQPYGDVLKNRADVDFNFIYPPRPILAHTFSSLPEAVAAQLRQCPALRLVPTQVYKPVLRLGRGAYGETWLVEARPHLRDQQKVQQQQAEEQKRLRAATDRAERVRRKQLQELNDAELASDAGVLCGGGGGHGGVLAASPSSKNPRAGDTAQRAAGDLSLMIRAAVGSVNKNDNDVVSHDKSHKNKDSNNNNNNNVRSASPGTAKSNNANNATSAAGNKSKMENESTTNTTKNNFGAGGDSRPVGSPTSAIGGGGAAAISNNNNNSQNINNQQNQNQIQHNQQQQQQQQQQQSAPVQISHLASTGPIRLKNGYEIAAQNAFVCKVINRESSTFSQVANEVNILANVAHPCIVAFIEGYVETGRMNLVMEYVDGGDLRKEIDDRRTVPPGQTQKRFTPEGNILTVFSQTCLAIEYLHRHNILHRDLKPENMIVSKKWLLKIADFGLAKKYENDIAVASGTSFVGTPGYVAPEVWLKKGFTEKSDMFSLGCVLYELITLDRPFPSHGLAKRDEIPDNLDTCDRRAISRMEISRDLKEVCDWLLEPDPTKRPTALEVLRVPIVFNAAQEFVKNFSRSAGLDQVDRRWAEILEDQLNDIKLSNCATSKDLRHERRSTAAHRIMQVRSSYMTVRSQQQLSRMVASNNMEGGGRGGGGGGGAANSSSPGRRTKNNNNNNNNNNSENTASNRNTRRNARDGNTNDDGDDCDEVLAEIDRDGLIRRGDDVQEADVEEMKRRVMLAARRGATVSTGDE